MASKFLTVKGAKEHNLKNVDVTIPRDKLVVFTGLSGSGKSSLAFDTIYAEGQRRYVESLSSYARQFLGQSATTLSGGEAQRVKLATELSRHSTGKTAYILDEPTTGLHTADVHRLIDVLQRFVDNGNTVIVIEHNLDVIKTADHIIDLGPEGGNGGGEIVVTGTPEEVAECEKSYTGKYLKDILKR